MNQPGQNATPRNGVTIGIPVFNEDGRIERAIRSAAPQCERLIVADNASTDATGEICQRLLNAFPNMEYFRHDRNIGALQNWHFLLNETRSDYFMTLGSHDYIDPDFIQTLLVKLEADSNRVLAAGGLILDYDDRSEGIGAFNNWKQGLQDEAVDRVWSLLFDRAHLAWAIYGLFKTDVYKQCFTQDLPPYGIDVVFLAKVAKQGKIAIVDTTSYHAWIRRKDDDKTGYVERILGKKAKPGKEKNMRNELRVALFDILASCVPKKGTWANLTLRYQVMVRFGTFTKPGTDMAFYLLYLPVKIARKFGRAFRLAGRMANKPQT